MLQAADLLILEGMPELDGGTGTALLAGALAGLKEKIRFTGPLPAQPPESLPGQDELKRRHAGDGDRPLVYVTIGGGTPLVGGKFPALVLDAFRRLPAPAAWPWTRNAWTAPPGMWWSAVSCRARN